MVSAEVAKPFQPLADSASSAVVFELLFLFDPLKHSCVANQFMRLTRYHFTGSVAHCSMKVRADSFSLPVS